MRGFFYIKYTAHLYKNRIQSHLSSKINLYHGNLKSNALQETMATLTVLNYACIDMLKIWVKSTVYYLLKMNYTNKKIKTKFYHFSNKHLPKYLQYLCYFNIIKLMFYNINWAKSKVYVRTVVCTLYIKWKEEQDIAQFKCQQ